MGLHEEIRVLLAQCSVDGQLPHDPLNHFERVARSVEPGTLSQAVASALRSDRTPPFAQLVSQLFSRGSGAQKATILNALISVLGPADRAELGALLPGLARGAFASGSQAAAVPPSAVHSLARHAEQYDPTVVDKMSALFAADPALVKTLGTAAMAVAMQKIADVRM